MPGVSRMYATCAQRRVREHVPQARRADPAGSQVLVAIEPRSELRLRVVEVDHDQPVEADPLVEIREERIDRRGLARVDPRRPGVGVSMQNPIRCDGRPRSGDSFGDGRQLAED